MEKVNINTITETGDEILCKVVSLTISSCDEKFQVKVDTVFSMDEKNFNVPSQQININTENEKRWKFIDGLDISDVDSKDIQLLIGADVPTALLAQEVKIGGPGLPHASKTPFGWALIGVHEKADAIPSKPMTIRHLQAEKIELESIVKSFWETESFGTEVSLTKSISIKDKENIALLDDQTHLDNGHYVVPMLWKSPINLPQSFGTASRRFEYLQKRFKRD